MVNNAVIINDMGKTKNSGCSAASSRAAAPVSAYDQFRQQHLQVHYLQSDSQVREMAKMVKDLKPEVVGLDFETTSKTGFFGELSGSLDGALRLIQIGLDEPGRIEPRQIVIDCHHTDPKPFLPLLRSKQIEKQIHYMEFEQSWALTHLGVSIGNIYDTCVASRKIQEELYKLVVDAGLPEVHKDHPDWSPPHARYRDNKLDRQLREKMEVAGLPAAQKILPGWTPHDNRLATISEQYMGLELPKEDQVSDWGRKRLTPSQLTYAAMDVAILPQLTEKVRAVAAKLDCQTAIDQKIQANKESIMRRVAEAEERRSDDFTRIDRALRRAKTKEELDEIFAAARQMTVRAKSKDELRHSYREIRAELP
jgi:ribonuclease D